jgi:hypothetical protein
MIIGLAGKKQHGKDTVARIIQSVRRDYKITGFAEPIRQIGTILGFTEHQMVTDKNDIHPQWDMSWRRAAQKIGTDLFREQFDQQTWIKLAVAQMRRYDNIIFTDVRFDNEAQTIRDLCGLVIQVVRPSMDDVDTHVSERGVSSEYFDAIVYNDGNLVQLKKKTMAIMRGLDI